VALVARPRNRSTLRLAFYRIEGWTACPVSFYGVESLPAVAFAKAG
jgi:hypothetical protein